MEILGVALGLLVLFVGFGLLVGIPFEMGRSFLVTPALFSLLGVPVPVAVGTDLLLAGSAFGARIGSVATSVVNRHRIV